MSYTIQASMSNCYEGTTVLINRFNIRSQEELDAVESSLVTAKAAQWEEQPLCDSFDFLHYRTIHRYLFCDLYDWAGEVRTVNISKKGTRFCSVSEIACVGEAIFQRLADKNFLKGFNRNEFVEAMTDLYERTNELHPFREGNGRTQRVFLRQLAQNANYDLDFSRIEPDMLMIATIQAANGFNDYLRKILFEIIKKNL